MFIVFCFVHLLLKYVELFEYFELLEYFDLSELLEICRMSATLFSFNCEARSWALANAALVGGAAALAAGGAAAFAAGAAAARAAPGMPAPPATAASTEWKSFFGVASTPQQRAVAGNVLLESIANSCTSHTSRKPFCISAASFSI